MQPKDAIEKILQLVDAPTEIKEEYAERLKQGDLTRDENLTTHFCSYFLPYRLSDRKVFLEAHKKSGLWLSPGGHIDPGETPSTTVEREIQEELGVKRTIPENELPKLLTITYIKQDVRACKVHFDIWYFIPMDGVTLATQKEGEFDNALLWASPTIENSDFVDMTISPYLSDRPSGYCRLPEGSRNIPSLP